MRLHYTFVHRAPPLARIRELALSVVLASKFYPSITVRTNFDLKRLGLPADIYRLAFREEHPWSIHKLHTYVTAEDDPYLHIDSDVFLFEPLPERLLKADLFAQNPESISLYGAIATLPDEWRREYILPLSKFVAYNMGIFGGKPEHVRTFGQFALHAAKTALPSTLATYVEQAPLGRFAADRGLTVETLLPKPEERRAVAAGYAHLMADKNSPEVQEKVAERLAKEAPEIADRLSCGPLRPIRNRVSFATVRDFWRNKAPLPKAPFYPRSAANWTLTNTPTGLGDTVVLTGVLEPARREGAVASIWTTSPHLPALQKFMPLYVDRQHADWVSLSAAGYVLNLGAGHNIQRACRLLGLTPPVVPKGHIVVPTAKPKETRVCLHLDPGKHAAWQRANIHPNARHIGPKDQKTLTDWIDSRPDLEFVEIGSTPVLRHPRVEDATGRALEDTIRKMANCGFHVGILSGPTHVAAALGLRIVTITTMPKPSELMLPTLVDTGIVEGEWLYPQSVVLHQEIDSPHWPLLSVNTLNAAIDGKVWPYWNLEGEME